MRSTDSNCYCESCYENEDDSAAIHDYHHKPSLAFHSGTDKDTLFMGFELESEGSRDIAEEIRDDYSKDETLFWFENDGSLDNGCEMVSHPCTLGFFRDSFPLEKVTKEMIKAGAKSHNTTTCGLHIHASRETLSEADQIKIGLFMGFNADYLKILGRRDYNTYCKEKTIKKGDMKSAKYSEGRYEAVNFTNRETIEFRFFKGTLKSETIYASLEFVHALCNFVKSQSFPTIVKPCWSEFCLYLTGNKSIYGNLIKFMEYKNIFTK